ncbi:M48 family metalloprotease, partial [Streptomyces olivaceoviridis]
RRSPRRPAGRWAPPAGRAGAPDAFVVPAAIASAGALAGCGWSLVRSVLGQARAFRAARAEAACGAVAGDLCVIDSSRPDAYALPGRPHRVVVTTAMLRSLDGPEREALLAHERAHTAGRHHYALAAAELAAHCHPALRPVRATIRLAAGTGQWDGSSLTKVMSRGTRSCGSRSASQETISSGRSALALPVRATTGRGSSAYSGRMPRTV